MIAEAADGCGRGWYYNGRRCVPMDEPGYGYRGDYGPPRYREDYGPPVGPGIRLDLGGRREPRYSPPNPAFKTWNNCPPTYTVQEAYVSRTQDLVNCGLPPDRFKSFWR
jgi:hypothetical protein